jgi:hypothetical protein
MNPGYYPTLSNEEYHNSAGISKSGLSLLRKTPAHYATRYINGAQEPATKAMVIGSAFHCFTLEPFIYDELFAVAPNVDRRTKAGKEKWEICRQLRRQDRYRF